METITYGPVHLQVTDLQQSSQFWTQLIGLQILNHADILTLGTPQNPLVILHPGATQPFQLGYSGLYHLAIHIPTQSEFARILARLINTGYPISPTDHIMSQAIYLTDPDGITIEITHETPHRFDHYAMESGRFQVIDINGQTRGATEPLDVSSVLRSLTDQQLERPLPNDVYIGHVHLYVNDLITNYNFYQQLGFQDNLLGTQVGFADLSASGQFKHRLAMNTWQSLGQPQAPDHTAGLKYFTLQLDTPELQFNLTSLPTETHPDGQLLTDPSGNQLVILS